MRYKRCIHVVLPQRILSSDSFQMKIEVMMKTLWPDVNKTVSVFELTLYINSVMKYETYVSE